MSLIASPVTFVTRELDFFLSISGGDWSSTFLPSTIIALGAAKRSALPIFNAIRCVPWIATYAYFFNLANQITGVEEDRINNPHRVLPTGRMTLEGAKRRCAIAFVAFMAVAIRNGSQIVETAAWVLITIFLSLPSTGGHWITKNVVALSVGCWTLLSGSYKAVAIPTEKEFRFFVAVSLWVSIGSSIQDFRDVKGDTIAGRKTLLITMGDKWGRRFFVSVMLPLSCYMLWAGNVFIQAPVTLAVAHVILAYRVLQGGGDRPYDHKTYLVSKVANLLAVSIPIWCEL